jgi:hypothetical protein
MDFKENLKIITKTGFVTLRSIIVVLGFGVFLNWAFVIIAAVNASKLSSLAMSVLVLGFGIVMPIAYFLVGKAYGIRRGLSHVVNEQKMALFQYIINKILGKVQDINLNNEELKSRLSNPHTWLKKLPRPIRFVTKYLMRKVPFNKTIMEVAKNQTINAENTSLFRESVAKKLDERTPINIFEPDIKPFWLVVVFNVILMILTIQFIL